MGSPLKDAAALLLKAGFDKRQRVVKGDRAEAKETETRRSEEVCSKIKNVKR